ncbi:hypothetical protein O181_007645 [Austropuccinia psidii MF-1]|uniref:Glucose-methanol-choline oxidoreductase N-terminal domain-containing protein n=1 Tax=Austropuccinia psidii MF-1 TaxID=1389203 RepID=A0A9Q3BMT8_9BASI|nr:hypothetical protein [Austropuccinia psidii MF-1]
MKVISALPFLCLFYLAHGAPSSDSFDYIIVGGGTAGLALAGRLSEEPSLRVLVLEAGGTGYNHTGIKIPGLIGSTLGTHIDWNYWTVPQKNANNRRIPYPRGKVLGGSSAINFLASTKASRDDYDAIEKLGNPGWGWSEIDRLSKKSEGFLLPTNQSNLSYNVRDHGRFGPVATSFPKYVPPQFLPYFSASASVGHMRKGNDSFSGTVEGAFIFPSAIDDKSTRVTSSTAYYLPHQSRNNLFVKTNCEVNKLLLKKSVDKQIQILGVEYAKNGVVSQALASQEVILSAGSVGSPAILERSGIGKSDLLKTLKIPIALELEGVGSNLADHPIVLGTYRLRPGIVSADDLLRNATFAARQREIYAQTGGGLLGHAISLLDYQGFETAVGEDEMKKGLKLLKHDPRQMSLVQYQAVVERLRRGSAVEFALVNSFLEADSKPDPNTSYLTIAAMLQYPLSRGSVHIKSADPNESPSIDPGFLSHPFDEWLLAHFAKHARKIMAQLAFERVILNEQLPGPSVNTDKEWVESVKQRVRTEYHPLGTSSMMPLSDGGVVDPELKVYGTNNLRIVDASILPIHLATHPTMTVYAIAEKAAEMILRSKGLNRN